MIMMRRRIDYDDDDDAGGGGDDDDDDDDDDNNGDGDGDGEWMMMRMTRHSFIVEESECGGSISSCSSLNPLDTQSACICRLT